MRDPSKGKRYGGAVDPSVGDISCCNNNASPVIGIKLTSNASRMPGAIAQNVNGINGIIRITPGP